MKHIDCRIRGTPVSRNDWLFGDVPSSFRDRLPG